METIGVVLTAYRRPEYFLEQVEAIKAQSKPASRIMVWKNHHNQDAAASKKWAEIIRATPDLEWVVATKNLGVWPRLALCQELGTEWVALFNDDSVPGARWFENCLQAQDNLAGIYGNAGVIFPEGKRNPRQYVSWTENNTGTERVDIVGHAWFFKREWLGRICMAQRQGTDTCGEDYYLSVGAQLQCGLDTYVPPRLTVHDSGSVNGMYGKDDNALWKQPGEEFKKEQAHEAYRKAGWKTIHDRGK